MFLNKNTKYVYEKIPNMTFRIHEIQTKYLNCNSIVEKNYYFTIENHLYENDL